MLDRASLWSVSVLLSLLAAAPRLYVIVCVQVCVNILQMNWLVGINDGKLLFIEQITYELNH